jgi:hypothetical protein
MNDIAGWPHWEISFDKSGNATARADLLNQITQANLTDLIFMSHGWGASTDQARQLYQQWFSMLPPLLPNGSAARLGTVGVFWPALLWPDEPPPGAPAASGGGAAGLAEPDADGSLGAPLTALNAVYTDPAQQQILSQMNLLDAQSTDPQALTQFHDLMRQLAATEPEAIAAEDSGALTMLTEDPRALATRFAAALDTATIQARTGVPATGPLGQQTFDEGGAADLGGGAADLPDISLANSDQGAAGGIGDITGRIWSGMKEAFRGFSYWQMKQRAGTVGQQGLGPFLGDLARGAPDLRVHLIGHSFGARLVSFSLAGLPDGTPSPVRSLTLLEGAFSHFAFAPTLPQDSNRSGALKGMMERVRGPLLACYSSYDTAVGVFYPAASMTANDDAAGLTDDLTYRWGGMGHDGAQAVGATILPLKAKGAQYDLTSGGFTNIDASGVVKNGGPPSGAHSDIVHPELGWAMLSAAGLT